MTDKSGNDELLQFPTEFPIKIMGRDSDDFEQVVVAIFAQHLDDIDAATVQKRPSSSGNFVSVTVTFTATSKQQVDAIYQALTDHEQVLFCL